MPAVYKTARFAVRPDSLDRCRKAIDDFVAEVKRNEPGTCLYTALQESDDTTRFLHVFAFEDEEAERRHTQTEWVKRFTGVLYPETLDGVEFTTNRLVVTT